MSKEKRPANWREFWDAPNSVFAGPRHRALHDDIVARDISRAIPSDEAIVLDFGCGKTTAAEEVARHCKQLILSDAAPTVIEELSRRYNQHTKIAILPAFEIRSIAPQSLDCIILNSVIQYLSREEFYELLYLFQVLL